MHDLTAARIWGIVRALAASGLIVLADKGYHGSGDHFRVPYRGRNKPASQKDANRAHAQLRSPGERANAQLKTWRIRRKLRCCPWRAGQLAKAIHVFRPARSEDEKRSVASLAGNARCGRHLLETKAVNQHKTHLRQNNLARWTAMNRLTACECRRAVSGLEL